MNSASLITIVRVIGRTLPRSGLDADTAISPRFRRSGDQQRRVGSSRFMVHSALSRWVEQDILIALSILLDASSTVLFRIRRSLDYIDPRYDFAADRNAANQSVHRRCSLRSHAVHCGRLATSSLRCLDRRFSPSAS